MNTPPDRSLARHDYQDGDLVVAKDGSRYRLANHAKSIVREVPKVRGKAARRADKKRRRAVRYTQLAKLIMRANEIEVPRS